MFKASVELNRIEEIFDTTFQEIAAAVDANLEEVAKFVKVQAKITGAFVDRSGLLRSKIGMRKSKYENGGYIVFDSAPHAHLVEFGHEMVLWGERTSERVPAHSYMRPAVEKGYMYAIVLFREAQA